MENAQKKKWFWVVLLGIASLFAVAITVSLVVRKPALEIHTPGGRALSPPVEIPPFRLIDQQGKPFGNSSLQGNWTLAMLGFTYCPDVCPTMLSKMAAFFTKLGAMPEGGKLPRFVFISVDPFRDTPDVLGKYVAYFRQGFIGLTGTPADIHRLVTGLGLHYIYTDPEDDRFLDDVLHRPAMKDYGVVHSSRVLFISPQAKLVAVLSQPFAADDVLAVFTELRAYYGD